MMKFFPHGIEVELTDANTVYDKKKIMIFNNTNGAVVITVQRPSSGGTVASFKLGAAERVIIAKESTFEVIAAAGVWATPVMLIG